MSRPCRPSCHSPCQIPLWSILPCPPMSWRFSTSHWTRSCQPLLEETSPLPRPRAPRRAQHLPGSAWTRARTPLDASEHRHAPSTLTSPSLSPGTNRVATVPSTSQTTPCGRARPVAIVTDDELPPPYCHAARKRTTRPFLPLPRHDARQLCHDVANTSEPSPMTLAHRSLASLLDLPRSTTATTRRYKRGHPTDDFFTPPRSTTSPEPP
jgi:hypothetical protein